MSRGCGRTRSAHAKGWPPSMPKRGTPRGTSRTPWACSASARRVPSIPCIGRWTKAPIDAREPRHATGRSALPGLFLRQEIRGRQITLTGVVVESEDRRTGGDFRQLLLDRLQRRARRNTHEHAFLTRATTRHFLRIGGADLDGAVDAKE